MILRQVRVDKPLNWSICGAMIARGMTAIDLAGDVIAYLDTICDKGISKCFLRVVKALLQHANRFHNRVFVSIAELAYVAKVKSTTTVEQILKLLVAVGAIRLVQGAELYEGDPCGVNDGPHRHAERGVERRKLNEEGEPVGRHPVNTYDITGFYYCLPFRRRQELVESAKNRDKAVKLTDAIARQSIPVKKTAVASNKLSSDASPGSISLTTPSTPDTRGAPGNAIEQARDDIPPRSDLPRDVSSVGIG
ncbi:MAG: hypothetical protein EON58_12040, partial [Alphaproteobacteria bacterium]